MDLKILGVFDLDRTLLDDTSSISADLELRLSKAMVPGLACTIASGRDFEHIAPYVEQLGWKSLPVIAEQGAVIVDPAGGNVLSERLVSPDIVAALLRRLRTVGVPITVILYGRNPPRLFRNAAGAASGDSGASSCQDDALPEIPRYAESVTRDLRKISVKCSPEDCDVVREQLSMWFGSEVSIVKADINFINIMASGVSKGMGLQWLMDHIGVVPENVMAVGDCEADRSMFSVAGVSVVVANADATTLSMARYVVPSNNQQGAAVALEKFAHGEFGRPDPRRQ